MATICQYFTLDAFTSFVRITANVWTDSDNISAVKILNILSCENCGMRNPVTRSSTFLPEPSVVLVSLSRFHSCVRHSPAFCVCGALFLAAECLLSLPSPFTSALLLPSSSLLTHSLQGLIMR